MNEKSLKIRTLEKFLRWMAQKILQKYEPRVIGITGSIGKTSSKDAIFCVLREHYFVRQTQKNYNNEIGVPLTIIGVESGGGSYIGWCKVIVKGMKIILFSVRYPEVLLLELGIDRPGDMDYLLDFIPIDISVVTSINNAHREFFKDTNHIAREKGKLVAATKQNGFAILNDDDSRVRAMEKRTKAKVITYGTQEKSEIVVTDIHSGYQDSQFQGLTFKVNYEGKIVPFRLQNIVARHHIYAALSAIAVGTALKMNLIEISQYLTTFTPPVGRMNRIDGVNGSLIIDDTYNASPQAMYAALETMTEIPHGRTIAVLGDMLELGIDSEKEHLRIGKEIIEKKISYFFAVGMCMEVAYHNVQKKGLSHDKVFYFEDPLMAGKAVKKILKKGDAILVKGSQGMRMEKVVEEIMAKPEDATTLLCRQTKEWKKIPFKKRTTPCS